MNPTPSRTSTILAAAILLVVGCGQTPASSSPLAAAGPVASNAVSPADLQSWRRFRLVYGLRADIDWVVQLAQDPQAFLNDYGMPLLPEELNRVAEANFSADNLVPAARRYAEAFPTFGGLWLELPRVVLAFSDDAPERRTEVEALFGGAVLVREVEYSLQELQAFENAVKAERDWITSLGVDVIDISFRAKDSVVNIYYQAPTRDVEPKIRERLGEPAWLTFEWAGPPPWTGPSGRLELVVVDQRREPTPARVVLRSLDPRVDGFGPFDAEDKPFIGRSWAAVDWEAVVLYVVDGMERTITKKFTVPADGVIKVRIVIED